jgi:hypothetical protein
MHKGKLQVTFTPSVAASVTSPNLSTSIYSLRHIIDIAQKDTFELNLPYLANTHYLSNNNTQVDGGNYSGTFDIQVLNELRAPETCAASVDILIWMEPGDDFEFAAPGTLPGVTGSVVPFVPQASIEDLPDTLVSSGIGGSMIMPDSLSSATQCIGERFLSVKQLINRLSRAYITGSTTTNTTIAIWPYFTGEYTIDVATGALTAPMLTGDIISLLMPCYAYYRGGVRVGINTNNTSGSSVVSLTPGLYPAANVITGASSTDIVKRQTGYTPATNKMPTLASVFESDNGLGMISAVVPYYSRTPMSLSASAPLTCRTTSLDAPTGVMNLAWSTGGNINTSTVAFYRSGCDDYQLQFFVGCPPLMYSYA